MAPFVGRSRELQRIHELMARIEEQHIDAILFVGDPGIGKSRLLAEGTRRLPEGRVIRISGAEPERTIPFAAARPLIRSDPVEASDTLLNRLTRATGSGSVEQLQVFEAVHRSLSGTEGLILVVDDLQWVDDATIALIHYLVRAAKTAGRGLGLLAASRPSPNAAKLLASLERMLDGESDPAVQLEPLPRGDGIAYVNSLAGDISDETAADMWKRAGGSPFWLGVLAIANKGSDPAKAVRNRLRGLGADAAALLALLAVAGRPLDLDDIAELLAWPDERVAAASSDVIDLGIAVSTGTVVRFAHDLIREAVLADVPATRSQRLHQRLTVWVEHLATNDPLLLVEALEHAIAAGSDPLGIAHRLVTSSHRRLLGKREVLTLCAAADGASVADARVVDLQEALARLLSDLNHVEEAYQRWSIVLDYASDPRQHARAALEASKSALLIGREERAIQLIASAEPSSDDAMSAAVPAHRSALLRGQGKHDEARDAALRAVEASRELVDRAGGPDALAPDERRACLDALTAVMDSAMVDQDARGTREAANEAAALARAADVESRLRVLLLGSRATMLLDVRNSIEQARQAWREAAERMFPGIALDAAFFLANALRHHGALAEAEEIVGDAIQLANRVGEFVTLRYPIRNIRRMIDLSRGRWLPALGALERGAAQTNNPHYRLRFRQEQALWKSRLDPRPSADDIARWIAMGIDDAHAVGCDRCLAELQLRGAESTARIGRVEDAEALRRDWETTQQNPGPYWSAVHAVVLGLIRRGSKPVEAEAHLDDAVRSFDELELGLDGMWARLDLATTLARVDQSRAADTAREAGQLAEKGGALTEAAVAEQILRRLGTRTWRRSGVSAASDSGLSNREREVAELAVAGHDNRTIAASLFLSPKTVERHLSNVFAKLGVKNRVELAGRLRPPDDSSGHSATR